MTDTTKEPLSTAPTQADRIAAVASVFGSDPLNLPNGAIEYADCDDDTALLASDGIGRDKCVKRAEEFARHRVACVLALEAELAKTREQLETERIRLAACGTAALGYCKRDEPIKDEYRSASLGDVWRLYEAKTAAEELIGRILEAARGARGPGFGVSYSIVNVLLDTIGEVSSIRDTARAELDKPASDAKGQR